MTDPVISPLVVICPDCGRPMNGTSCAKEWAKPHEWPDEPDEDAPCNDCGTPIGGLHHHHCDKAMCIQCGRQLLMCEHLPPSWDEIPPDKYHFGGTTP
jgi:hypothetical protein